MKRTIKLLLSLVAISLVCVYETKAYETYGWAFSEIKWLTNTQNMSLSKKSFPSGSWRTAMVDTITELNSNPSKITWRLNYNDTSVWFLNAQSEMWFSTNSAVPGKAPAMTLFMIAFPTNFLTEADIIFNTKRPWTSSQSTQSLWQGNRMKL